YGGHASEALSVEQLASRYAAVLREQLPRGPYHLAGMCLGGIIAYEVARQLVASGHDVRTLSLFDARLPRAVTRHQRARLRSWLSLLNTRPGAAFNRAVRAAGRLCEP